MEEAVNSLLDTSITDEKRTDVLARLNEVLIQVAQEFDKKESEQLYIQEGTVGVFKITL
jgi:hypothetical protein